MCDTTYSYVWHDSFICVTWLIHMCDLIHSCVWHDLFICVTWLIHMCDMTHSHVWRDSFICVTWLIHMCHMTYANLRLWFIDFVVSWFVHMNEFIHSHVTSSWQVIEQIWLSRATCMDWFIRMNEFIHSHVTSSWQVIEQIWIKTCHVYEVVSRIWSDSFIYVTRLDSFVYVTNHRADMNKSCHVYELIHSYTWHNLFISALWLIHLSEIATTGIENLCWAFIHMCAMTPRIHVYAWYTSSWLHTETIHGSFICVWTISRLLEIIGLFCKRAL